MSASVSPSNQIKLFWDSFFQAETGTYEKSTWLDLLMAEFLIQIKDGVDPLSVLSFCSPRQVVTLVGCEVLCGVHCVTSSSCVDYLQSIKNENLAQAFNVDFSNIERKADPCVDGDHKQNDDLSVAVVNSFQRKPSSIKPLQKYILKGVAWRCLALLQAYGVEGLSCSRQLSVVLVWLYGELSRSGAVANGENPYLPACRQKPQIHQLFSNRIWIKKYKVPESAKTSKKGKEKDGHISRSRKKKIGRQAAKSDSLRRNFMSHPPKRGENDHSSDSDPSNLDLQLLNRSFMIKARQNQDDFAYYTYGAQQDAEESTVALYSPRKRTTSVTKTSADYITDRHRAVMESEISQYEFCNMTINLLFQLCQAEDDASGSEGLHINVQCVNFAVRHLCTLQFESSPASALHLTSTEAARLKACLAELLIVSLDKVLVHPDLSLKIIHNGILPMLLRLLEDITYKLYVRMESSTAESSTPETVSIKNFSPSKSVHTEATDNVQYLFGVTYAIMAFFYCLLMQHRSMDKLLDFTEQFKLFEECQKGLLFRESIALIMKYPGTDKSTCILLVKKLIDLLSRLISGMKRVRSEIVHSALCNRGKHKQCRSKVSLMMHHHNDYLGTCYPASGNLGLSPACCVAILYGTLTSLLGDKEITKHAVLRSKLLRSMKKCGSCCCFSAQYLLNKVIGLIHSHRGTANLCFSILEQTLYGEMGATKLSSDIDLASCIVCKRYFVSNEMFSALDIQTSSPIPNNKNFFTRNSTQRFFYEENIVKGILDASENKTVWPFLSKYNALLQLDDHAVIHATMSHLLRVSALCNDYIKHDLLFCVLYLTFLNAKSRYITSNSEASYFVTYSCLNAFSTLLGSASFAEEFIQIDGLTGILELMALPEFSKQCCSVLEIAVVIEIFKLKLNLNNLRSENNVECNVEEIKNLHSVEVLFKSLDDMSEKAFKYFRMKINTTIFSKLVDLSNENDVLFCNIVDKESNANDEDSPFPLNAVNPTVQKKSLPIDIKGPSRSQSRAVFEMQFSSMEQIIDNHVELLKNIWTFWKTGAALCLYCPLLRKYFIQQKVFRDSYKLLKLALHCVCHVSSTITEKKMLVKILEAIVTITLSVADCTMDRSKEVTLELLQEALLTEDGSTIDGTNMKSLFELLTRAATVYASEEQVMPPANKIKLPPLLFSSNSDEEYHSSGDEEEGESSRPYMSEESDPYHTADEGYEADAELGLVEMVPLCSGSERVFVSTNNSQNLEHSIQSISSISKSGFASQPENLAMDQIEYKRSSVITHPELCTMTVDILVNLIDRILKSPPSSSSMSASATSSLCGIVSSCTARLASLITQETNCSAGSGIISQMLSGPAAQLLKINAVHLEELQRCVLHLIYILASRSILSTELHLYLKLFISTDIPLGILLEPLWKLVDSIPTNVPDYIVCFPIDRNSQLIEHDVTKRKSSVSNCRTCDNPSSQIEHYVKSLHVNHVKSGMVSSWSCMGMWFGIERVGWGLWLQGCALSLWLRVQEVRSPPRTSQHPQPAEGLLASSSSDGFVDYKSANTKGTHSNRKSSHRKESKVEEAGANNLLHMMSLGDESLALEFWVNTKNGDLTVRLTRSEADSSKVFGQTVVDRCLPLHQWNHLAMNVRETMMKREIYIEVQIFVNGVLSHTAAVQLNGILLRKSRPACLTLGHSVGAFQTSTPATGSWFLSGLALFRSPILTECSVLYLMAHGPNNSTLNTQFQTGNQQPNFTSLFAPNILASDVDWDQVLDISSVKIKEMQENLLLIYSAHNPGIVELYHQTVTSPTMFVGRAVGGSKCGGMGVPVPLPATWTGLMLPSQHRGLLPALYLLGGPQIFLYLFARVVELDGSSEEQAKALSIFLKVCYSDTRLYSMLQQDDLLSMLQTVFASPKCKMTHHLLKAMLDAACDLPVLNISGDSFHSTLPSDAIIVCPEILITILKSWRELEKPSQDYDRDKIDPEKDYQEAENKDMRQSFSSQSEHSQASSRKSSEESGGVLATLFIAMNAMLRENNPFRMFNVYQMNRVNMVDNLLLFCKERFLNSDLGRLNVEVSCGLVEVIGSLMGCPPLLHHVALLADFLVLMHQASSTFITHSRSSFYFLLTPTLHSNTNSNVLGLPLPYESKRRSKSSRKKRLSSSASNQDTVDFAGIAMKTVSSHPNIDSLSLSVEADNIGEFLNEEDFEMISTEVLNDENVLLNDNVMDNNPAHLDDPVHADTVKNNKAIINAQIKQRSAKKDKMRKRRSRSARRKRHSSTPSAPSDNNILATNVSEPSAGSPNSSLLGKEYIVIESEEVDRQPIQNDSITMYQQLRSPVLLHNLRTGSSRSWTICEGILILLRDTILIMPDTSFSQVLSVLRIEILLILANHGEASVRAGVVKAIGALVQRCPAEQQKHLEHLSFFHHLANQLSQKVASYDLVSACASLITEHRTTLEDQLEDDAWSDVTEKSIMKSPPLLAVLPHTLHETSLAHNTLLLFHKIVEKGSVKILSDIGICEVILKCLKAVGTSTEMSSNSRQLIIEDLRSVLCKITLKAIVMQNNAQIRTDLHYQLCYLELMERTTPGTEDFQWNVSRIIRDTQCRIFKVELDYLEDKLNTASTNVNQRSPNYFQSVLSAGSGSDRDSGGPWYEELTSMVRPGRSSSPRRLSRSELKGKHSTLLTRASTFLVNRDVELEPSQDEIQLIERIFMILVNITSGVSSNRSKWWGGGLGMGGEWRPRLCDMFMWLVSPAGPPSMQAMVLRAVWDAPHSLQRILTPTDPSGQRKLAVYLSTALEKLSIVSSEDESVQAFTSRWIASVQPLGQRLLVEALSQELQDLVRRDVEQRQLSQAQTYTHINKSIFSKDALAIKLTDAAMAITRLIVDTQNSERKSFLEHLRQRQGSGTYAVQRWRRMLEQLGHQEGVWSIPGTGEESWELDPTEGPARVRVRLRRCHLDIAKKFVREEFHGKLDNASRSSPLSYLFEAYHDVQSGLLERLHLNESVSFTTKVVYVTVKSEQSGELLLSDRCIHFLPDDIKDSLSSTYWPLDSITLVSPRRWQLIERAAEVFLSSGQAHLIAFQTTQKLEAFMAALNNCHLPNRYETDTLSESAVMWRNGTLTNWEYLMQLNGWAGRSYNDLMQYPVLPFVLADYTSSKLDLNDPATFRDLRKPMAVQNKSNETHYVENYNHLDLARKECPTGVNREPYHYGSHYSNSGTVLHFLVRLPPFTKLFLSYQDNKFDIPDRTFHSLQSTWRLTSCDSTTDVKELIPEFFYLPHFLCNFEGLELGVQQSGAVVNHVKLASWAPSARLFCLIHRQALESANVRENLPHWIDLVFGYKQTGQAAIDAINVFHPATYYGFDLSVISDPLEKKAWETMVRTYGQTPRQLFKQAHPQSITDFQHVPQTDFEVLPSVSGLRWGSFCGSPQEPAPLVTWRRLYTPAVMRLTPLLTNEVIGVPPHTTIMVTYAKSVFRKGNAVIGTVGLITWGHSDGIIRIKQKKDMPPEPLVQIPNIDQVTVVSHGTGSTLSSLWLGLHSGCILVLPPAPVNASPPGVAFCKRPARLLAHHAPLATICVCAAFGVAASGSVDGTIVLWDADRLTYIRTIPNNGLKVSHICISETLCDIASVHPIPFNKANTAKSTATKKPKDTRSKSDSHLEHSATEKKKLARSDSVKFKRSASSVMSYKSVIRVHTVNGDFVGEVSVPERVTCVCYSTAPEGVSVNVLAAGLQTGGVRLYSSWNLMPVRHLVPEALTHPLVSITYSHDAQHLFTASSDGTVLIWQGANTSGETPTFRILTSLSIL